MITDVVLNGSKAILVDKKLIEGPNPNERGKLFIPFILAFQVSSELAASFCIEKVLGTHGVLPNGEVPHNPTM